MNCNFKKRMWLAGASLLAIVLGSGDANAVVFGTGGSEFVIPATGFYDFSVGGAQGSAGSGAGSGGGKGALVGGELFLDAGTALGIIAGGLAGYESSYRPLGQGTGGGGGGGSFVFNVSRFPAFLLFAAGGGGGNGFFGPVGSPGIGGGGSSSGYNSGGGGGAGYTSPGRFVGPHGPYYTPNPAGYFGIRATAGADSGPVPGGRGQLLCGGAFAFGFSCRADGEDGGYGGGGGSGYNYGGGGGGSPGGAGGSNYGDHGGHGGYSYVINTARNAFGITGGNSGAGFVSIDFVGSSVPEPSTWAMMLAGFTGLGWLARLRRRKLTPT
jgi:PEP-CTERM motif